MYIYIMGDKFYDSVSKQEPLSKYVLALEILQNENTFLKMEVFDNPIDYESLIKTLKAFEDEEGNCLSMHMIKNYYEDTTQELFDLLLNKDFHKNNNGNTQYMLNLIHGNNFTYSPSDEELNAMNNNKEAPLDIKPDLVIPGKLLLDGETLIHLNVSSFDQNTIMSRCRKLLNEYMTDANLKDLKFLIGKGVVNKYLSSVDDAVIYFIRRGIYKKDYMVAVKKDDMFDEAIRSDSEFLLAHFREEVAKYYGNPLAPPSIKLLKLIDFMKKNIDKMDLTTIEHIPIPESWLGMEAIEMLVEEINKTEYIND